MQSLSAGQCRAARALLGWSQPDLAKRCGIHVQTISAFEGETGTPTKTTLTKLTEALERAGIEFLPNNGVSQSSNPIHLFEGPNAYFELLDDVYETLKGTSGEVWLSGVSEPTDNEKKRKEYLMMHINRLLKEGIKERLLVKKGDKNFLAPREWYRWMPDKFDNSNLFYIYADKTAFVEIKEENFRIMIFENKLYTRVLKDLYEFTWKHAEIPT